MRILATGSAGQLGQSLVKTLSRIAEVTATTRSTMDIADPESIAESVADIRPDLIVNAAAFTDVDKAETDGNRAFQVNGVAPGLLGKAAAGVGAVVVHYSTDYVFDGKNPAPYRETDTPRPLNVYGASKLAGEKALRNSGAPHLIMRVSWLYSAAGKNFLNTILQLAREKERLDIVEDQVGAPTSAAVVARATASIIELCDGPPREFFATRGGLFHFCCNGSTSWKGFAEEIVRGAAERGLLNRTTEIRSISSDEYPLPARRPRNSRLDTRLIQREFGIRPTDWKSALSEEFDSDF